MFIGKETPTCVLPVNITQFLKAPILKDISEIATELCSFKGEVIIEKIETYSETSELSDMEVFAKIVDSIQPFCKRLHIFCFAGL